jgi:N-methylhydantoinase A/oxoprolinase/acetone carboxylase beta subunit
VYAEYNDSQYPNRDWEFSVEFYPEEQAEYAFYIAASQGQVEVRTEIPRKQKQTRRREAARSRQHVPLNMLRRARH